MWQGHNVDRVYDDMDGGIVDEHRLRCSLCSLIILCRYDC